MLKRLLCSKRVCELNYLDRRGCAATAKPEPLERASGMDKSPDAFRTISEVAEELDLPQHVLRFWETRFTQIKPMKRGGWPPILSPA
jgi:hypothetical protein